VPSVQTRLPQPGTIDLNSLAIAGSVYRTIHTPCGADHGGISALAMIRSELRLIPTKSTSPAARSTRGRRRPGASRPLAVACAIFLSAVGLATSAVAESAGEKDYKTYCARCHGADGKGQVAAMARVPGYMSVDLTRLSARHGGKFPRQEVYDAISGQERFPAHFVGDMPVWGAVFREQEKEKGTAASEAAVRRRISALVEYVESLQQN
jgi:mono/diheme cytochrome c family protein